MRLGNVIEINPEQARREYPYEEIKYIDISSVGTGRLLDTKIIKFANAPSRAKRIVRNKDILLATVRPNLRSFWFAQNIGKNTIASTGFAILRATEEADPRFIYYTVTNQCFTDYLTANAKGAAYPAVDTETIERAEVYLPPLSIQSKIAAILSAYDDLIENNLRRIKILEEMAQNLYREWFVNFRFPGHENTRFVDSPLGQIPERWEVIKVGDLLEKLKRVTKVPKSKYIVDGHYPVIDQGKDFIGGFTDDEESVISNGLPLIVFGDHTRVLKYIDFPFARGADGTQLLKSNNERMPMSLFYYSLLAIDLSSYAYARHFKFLRDEKVLLPDIATAVAFDKFLSPTLDNIKILMKKNDILRQTRDLLLPKLISGEVDVSDLDINVTVEVTI